MSDVVTPEAVYEWRAPIPPELAKKGRLTLLGTVGGGAASIAWGVAAAVAGIPGDVRLLTVMGVMLLTIGMLGRGHSGRLRSTVIRVDRLGTLTVSDAKRTDSIDLRTVSALAIRERSGRPQWLWSIEAVHRAGAWHTELPALAGYWNLAKGDVAELEAELRRWLAWATGTMVPASSPAPDPAANPDSTTPGSTAPGSTAPGSTAPGGFDSAPIPVNGTVTSTAHVFEWQPPQHPNKARNRRRLRIGVVGFAVLIAVFAAVSEAENGVSAVIFSMFVPVLILVIGFGLDRAYDYGRRFRLGVDERGLWIRRSSKEPVVIARTDVATLTLRLSHDSTHDADVETTSWTLGVDRRTGDPVNTRLPLALGSSFSRNDAIALEAELRRRLGV